MLSCEFCDISKNTFFTKHLRATAYVTNIRKTDRNALVTIKEKSGNLNHWRQKQISITKDFFL